MGSVDEFGAVVGEAETKLDELVAALSRASAAGGELADGLAGLGADGRAAEARAIVADVDTETNHATSAKPRLAAIRTAIEGLRGLLTRLTGNRDTPRTTPPRPFDPTPYLDDMPEMTPKAKRRRGQPIPKTHGRWVGGEIPEWISGEDDQYKRARHAWTDPVAARWDSQRPDYAPRLGPNYVPSVLSHVEIKFAAFMRDAKRTDETLVINHPDGPCAGLLSCQAMVEIMLEPESKLSVYWPGGQHTFVGKDDR